MRDLRTLGRLRIVLAGVVALAACSKDASGMSRTPSKTESTATPSMSQDGGSPGSPFSNSDARIPDLDLPDGSLALPEDASTNAPDDDTCGSVVLKPRADVVIEPGTVLVVFDNSGSMGGTWNSEIKWRAAADAIAEAIVPIQENLTVGAIIFPMGSASCEVAAIDSGDQIRLLPGGSFLTAWSRFVSMNAPNGGTPLGPALRAADDALAALATDNIDVVVLTDGAPSGCDTAAINTLPGTWFSSRGIRTHVVGLPGSDAAVALLDDMALQGGTMQHITPFDPRILRDELARIVSESVVSSLESCTIALDPPAADPDDVHVVVTEAGERLDVERDLGMGGGWTIAGDGSSIELHGVFCDKGLAGDYERIAIEIGCVDLPPLPPPKGPD